MNTTPEQLLQIRTRRNAPSPPDRVDTLGAPPAEAASLGAPAGGTTARPSEPSVPAHSTQGHAPLPIEDADCAPLWSIGFRPFFLLGTLAAVLLVPLWLLLLELGHSPPHLPGPLYHAHEMVFGFTVAVIAGFLLTAGSNWTKRRIASGRSLRFLVALWVAGRIAFLLPGLPASLVAFVDLAFLPALGWVFSRALVTTGNRRNYVFIGLLGLLGVSNALMHLSPLPNLGLDLALHVVTLMLLVVGGRVIPMFTRNATGNQWIAAWLPLEILTMGAFLTACLVSLALPGPLAGIAWLLAGVVALLRMIPWGSWTARAPLLWVLHVGMAAVGASLLVRGLAELNAAPRTAALHLLTVGGIGLLTLGMMTRVSLGHSGRLLVAPARMTWAFALLTLATVSRAFGPWLLSDHTRAWWLVSGGLWTIAFGLLLSFGWSIWTSPRVDAPGAT